MPLAVRNDTLAALAGTDGDYAPLQVNASGALFIQEGAALDVSGATVTVDGSGVTQPVSGTVTANPASGTIDTVTTVSTVSALGVGTTGPMKAEDIASANGDMGIPAMARRTATPADTSGADLDYEMLQMDNGRLWTSTTIDAALPAGTAAIGKLAANSGVDIGDVDVLSIAAGDNNIGNVDIVTVLTGSGALNLGKIEDGAHSGGDLGVMALAIRDDALAANAGVGADLDYVPLRTNNDGALWTQPSAGNLGGCKVFDSIDLDESEEDIATGACTVYGIYAWNSTAAPLWLQIFNTNTVTVGTTAPDVNFIVPANADSDGAGVVIPIPVQGLAFSTALTMAMTTGSGTTAGAPGANAGGVVVMYQD